MKCEMTATRTRSSPMGSPQDVRPGTVRPCGFNASRTCPACAMNLCNGHSRQLTTMGGKNPVGRHRCSACGHEWIP